MSIITFLKNLKFGDENDWVACNNGWFDACTWTDTRMGAWHFPIQYMFIQIENVGNGKMYYRGDIQSEAELKRAVTQLLQVVKTYRR